MLNGIKILVADDNLVNQKIAGFMLSRLRADVTYAKNGMEVIEMLRNEEYDVVLMDLQMPAMDGFAATEYIRHELKNDVPIIAVTADIFVSDTTKCTDAGMNACISKPFDPEGIGSLILSVTKKSVNNI